MVYDSNVVMVDANFVDGGVVSSVVDGCMVGVGVKYKAFDVLVNHTSVVILLFTDEDEDALAVKDLGIDV